MASTPIDNTIQASHPPRVFISADHGLAIVYFLQSDVVPTLLEAGVEVVLLTDDALKSQIETRFGRPGLIVEGLRLEQANAYARRVDPEVQWWLQTLRRVGSSNRINTQAMDSYIDQIAVEEGWKRRLFMPLGRAAIALLRRSRRARQSLVRLQMHYIPGVYSDLFQRYRPSLVVASTPGWRMDRYLLRQAIQQGIPTAAVVVGWDNPSSYSIPGAPVEHITCWSQVQKDELVLGQIGLQRRLTSVASPPTMDISASNGSSPGKNIFTCMGSTPTVSCFPTLQALSASPPTTKMLKLLPISLQETRYPHLASCSFACIPTTFGITTCLLPSVRRSASWHVTCPTCMWSNQFLWELHWVITLEKICLKKPP